MRRIKLAEKLRWRWPPAFPPPSHWFSRPKPPWHPRFKGDYRYQDHRDCCRNAGRRHCRTGRLGTDRL